MFIESLKIENGKKIIREILFHKGLNLIIDETITDDKKKSGNNVGKTTVLRLIDFCLGGKGENIFKDPEFKSKGNTLIEEFLKSNEVLVTLTLTNELGNYDAEKLLFNATFCNVSIKSKR